MQCRFTLYGIVSCCAWHHMVHPERLENYPCIYLYLYIQIYIFNVGFGNLYKVHIYSESIDQRNLLYEVCPVKLTWIKRTNKVNCKNDIGR